MPRRGVGWVRHVAAGALVFALVSACYAPTEIDAALTSDVGCDVVRSRGVAIRLASRVEELPSVAPVTETTECKIGGDLGTLTLVPGKSDEVVLEVVLGVTRPTAECRPPGHVEGCIVARRRLGFVTHEALRLPIALDRSCLGVPCGKDETCDRAVCVAALVHHCQEGVCEVGASPAAVADGHDGGSISGPTDGGPSTVATDAAAQPPDAMATPKLTWCGGCNYGDPVECAALCTGLCTATRTSNAPCP